VFVLDNVCSVVIRIEVRITAKSTGVAKQRRAFAQMHLHSMDSIPKQFGLNVAANTDLQCIVAQVKALDDSSADSVGQSGERLSI
jgi:hypothetical protein